MYNGRFAKLSLTALRSNFSQLEKPYKLTFSITYKCQSHCSTCGIWKMMSTGADELTLQEIREFAKRNSSFDWIELTGGEPFLRSDIVEIVKAFYDNCKGLYIVTMPTNSLCNLDTTLKKIEEILNLGIPKLSITLSLDGYRELHDKIRGVPGNFDRVMGMARKLHEMQKLHRNLFFIFGYTMSNTNKGMLERTYQEVKKELQFVTRNNFHINVEQISEVYYRNSNGENGVDRGSMSSELADFVGKRKFELGVIPIIESVFIRSLVKYLATGRMPMKSRSLDASLFMDSYGYVYPSIMWDRKLGSVRESGYGLSPIWHSKAAEEVRQQIKEGKEPSSWTACEAYQAIVGNISCFILG